MMKVSCIIPARNAEKYLPEALESARSQSRPIDEIIVVDNASTDATAALAEAMDDVRLLHQAKRGPAAARNMGIRAARGEILVFLDADDRWHPEKTAAQLKALAENPQSDLCVGHVENFWSPEIDPPAHKPALLAPWAGYTFSALMVRCPVFDRIGLLDETLIVGEDGDWFERFRQSGSGHILLPEVLSYRRLHLANLSRRLADLSRQTMLERFKNQLDARRRDA